MALALAEALMHPNFRFATEFELICGHEHPIIYTSDGPALYRI